MTARLQLPADLTPRDRAEAMLAHELRARGVERGRAALLAESVGDQMTLDAAGEPAVTLANGRTLTGPAALASLASALIRGGVPTTPPAARGSLA